MASTARTGSTAAGATPVPPGPARPSDPPASTARPPSSSAAGRCGPSGAVFSASPGCAAGDEVSSSLLPPTMPVWWALLWPGRGIGPGPPRDPRNEPAHGNRRDAGIVRLCPNKGKRINKPLVRSCYDSAEYFLRSVVFVSTEERRVENRNQRGFRSVNKRGSSSGQAGTGESGQSGGNRWGAGVIRAISRVARPFRVCGAHNEGEGA